MSVFVLDTNIISETAKEEPNPSVISWMKENAGSLFLTSVTVEELRFGEYMLPEGKRRSALKEWIDSLLFDYSESIFDFDARAADACAKFHEQAIASGHTPTIEDLMIAGIAKMNNATVITRNVRDFEYLDIPLINPFDSEGAGFIDPSFVVPPELDPGLDGELPSFDNCNEENPTG